MNIGDYINCERCGASIPVEAPPAEVLPAVDEIETDCPRCGYEICAHIEWEEHQHVSGLSAEDQFALEMARLQ